MLVAQAPWNYGSFTISHICGEDRLPTSGTAHTVPAHAWNLNISAMLHFAPLLEPRNCNPPGNFLKCPRVNSKQPQDLGTLLAALLAAFSGCRSTVCSLRLAWDSWCLRDVSSIPELSIEHVFPLWLGSGCDYADGQRDAKGLFKIYRILAWKATMSSPQTSNEILGEIQSWVLKFFV